MKRTKTSEASAAASGSVGRSAAKPAPRRLQKVRGAAAIALLASPVRQDLVDTLEALGGEADIATVAAQMGRAADGLYYHAELLAKAGLLQRIDADGGRRYRLGGGRGAALKLDYGDDAGSRAAVARVVDKLLQSARADFHAALAGADAVREGAQRDLWAGRAKGWVDARDLGELNRLLDRLQQLLRGPRRRGREQLVSLSFVLAPVAVRRRRSSADSDP